MDFSRGISIKEERGLPLPGTWVQVPNTPAKPIPTRPHPIVGERDGFQASWVDSVGLGMGMGMQADYTQVNPSNSNVAAANLDLNPTAASVHQRVGFNNWESALSGRKNATEPSMDTYGQAINNANTMDNWNSLPLTDLLAQASAKKPYFPFTLPENGINQLQPNFGHIMMEPNYSMCANQRNNSNLQAQIPQYGFPVPFSSTYDLNSTPRTMSMYNLNCSPNKIVDANTNDKCTARNAPVTPDKISRMQQNQLEAMSNGRMQHSHQISEMVSNVTMQHNQISEAVTNGRVQQNQISEAVSNGRMQHNQISEAGSKSNMPFQFEPIATPNMVRRMQHSQPSGVVASIDNTSFQFASLTPDRGTTKLLEAVSNGSILFQFAPLTPDTGSKTQQSQTSQLVINSSDGRGNQEKNKKQNGLVLEGSNYFDMHSSQESCLESVVNSSPAALEKPLQPTATSTCAELSTPSKENHLPGQENGIDLNKTPQQKQKRKKHRPKVVTEGKQKKSPKSTVKPDTKETPTDTPRVKRKYVRKNGANTSSTPPADRVEEINDANQCPARSCKRSLNFDLEGQAKTMRHQEGSIPTNLTDSSSSFAVNDISEAPQTNLCTSTNDGSGRITRPLPHELEMTVQNSLANVAFDLNRSANQVLGDYISLPQITPPQPSRREMLRTNLKVTRTTGECQNSGNIYQQGIRETGLMTENVLRNHGNSRNAFSVQHTLLAENKQESGMKRAYSQTNDGHPDLNGEDITSLQAIQEIIRGIGFPDVCKKKRTEKSQNATTSSRYSWAAVEDGHKEAMQYSQNANTNLCVSQGNPTQYYTASTKLSPPQGNRARTSEHCSPSLPRAHILHMQQFSAGPLSSTEETYRSNFDKLNSSELMLTIRQTEMQTGKRSKGHTRVRDLATLTSVTQCNNLLSPLPRNAPTSHDRSVTGSFQGTRYIMQSPSVGNNANMKINKYSRRGTNSDMVSFSRTSNMRLQEQQAVRSVKRQYSIKAKSRGSLEVVQRFLSPIDELVQRLACLTVSDESKKVVVNEQNALVPFKGDNRMIPYNFDPTKRRKPRPKVDLDFETDRVWKLLMGKEACESDEATNADKEKWWAEERRVLHGRADSFIARMHLIQGDRRFSRWNGSVLDSVIGVFLTQNVSDHLSSSAFMSLAARFPLKPTSNDVTRHEGIKMYVEEPELVVTDLGNSRLLGKMPSEPVRSLDSQSSVTLHEADHIEEKETGNTSESIESNVGDCCSSGISDKEYIVHHEGSKTKAGIITTGIGRASFVESEDGRILEVESSGISPQNSADSSLFQVSDGNMIASNRSATLLKTDRIAVEDVVSSKNKATRDEIIGSCSDSNSEEDPTTVCRPNNLNNKTSFMELLRITTMFQDSYNPGNEGLPFDLNSKIWCTQLDHRDSEKRSNLDTVNPDVSILPSSSKVSYTEVSTIPSSNCSQVSSNTVVQDVQCPKLIGVQSSSSVFSTSAIKETKDVGSMKISDVMEETTREKAHQKLSLKAQVAVGDVSYSLNQQQLHSNARLAQEACFDKHTNSWGDIAFEDRTYQSVSNQSAEPDILNAPAQGKNNRMQQADSNSPNFSGETLDVVESTLIVGKKDSTDNTDAESTMKEEFHTSKLSHETATSTSKQNGKPAKEKKKATDWDCLRKEAYERCGKRERNQDTMDSIDWEAVRCADVNEIANAIKERGMNNMLAERIKDFLNRIVREHGSIDLEWLRDVPSDKVKEYLLSVRGLGLKSVECIRLLTLHRLAFPVDTNVGRIAVRLGWVPLQPLPESLQLHLLEMYPILESIQKYLWPRLCTLDQRTLYELHYQLITFGKVFCTKNKPNCNACPMRAECRHFASAFASARFALPGPEEKGIVSSTVPTMANQNPAVGIQPMSLPPPEANKLSETRTRNNNSEPIIEVPASPTRITNSEPIIEVPASPEPECYVTEEIDIEDALCEDDADEIPTIKLSMEEFQSNLHKFFQQSNMELQDADMSKALVALNPESASLPIPKLKNVSRLRTEHQVYELPDSHPLLEGVEKRVPAEVSSYLLAIWTPGETAESTQPPERCCSSQMSGNLCRENTCFSCNSVREAHSQTVRGTLLIPCKTAMRGSFPLNGTYFQVNEVFADHASSLKPIDVPRAWLWNLPRRTVYFGTSIPTIFKGQSTEQIQSCFWRGFVCVRGFDRETRAPRPLFARLHFPASRLLSTKTKGKREE